MIKRNLPTVIAYLFILLFLYTGMSKLMDYSVFKAQIGSSPILEPIAPFVAWALPLAEFAVAALLFVPRTRLPGLYASFVLMVMFTGYIIAILNFSEHIPCSCGGVLENMSWQQHLVFNIIVTILALVGALLERKNRHLQTVDTIPLP